MADVQETLDAAFELGDEQRWEEMAELLSGALRENPDDAFLLCFLGVAEQELGNDGAAYDRFKAALAQEPDDPQLLATIGSGLAHFDDPEAEPALRAAALTGSNLVMTRLQYGAYLAREGLFPEALEHLEAAVRLERDEAAARGEPESPVPHAELGTALALKGDYAAAAAAMERALELATDDSWTRLLLGLIYVEQGELEIAAETLVQAAEERADDAEAQILAALAAAAQGWDDSAQDIIARAAYSAEGSDVELMNEAEDRISSGAEEALEMLRENIGPSVLHERLAQPL